ncbi:GMC oxidoreductase [Puia dinghuensis]|uniref:Oxidoreductase n=1 Tax=Puia dinghuensis TaxID=1792502 RepID=A0A8J2UHJ6_9BACT|nr:GMC family oxidoreductase [Puia dinghuensis]GGB16616.1 oxidoreductase [Puia dinghuensis]
MGDQQQTPNLNTKGVQANTYDAIVVGSGISGGWAAKELCEKGLKTLVLERGRNITHIKDYTTAFMAPWEFPHHLANTLKDKEADPVASGAYDEACKQFFVSDREHPYIQEKPFYWIRSYQVGGRSLTWGRQCYRLSDLDFEANAKEGIAVDWPIRYKDIAPWYDYVESFVGISGKAEGLPHLPDGVFLPPMDMTCVETEFAQKIKEKYSDRLVTIGRVANLTEAWKGRGPCQFRNLCYRGCPFSGYFSSNAATLPAAQATGNMTLLPDSIVIEVLYDKQQHKASGVRVMNAHTKTVTDYFARIIFLNASTIATASILLQSTSRSFPNGLGNSSQQVGHNLMDHFSSTGAQGEYEGFDDKYYSGRRPVGIYMPRFQNLGPSTARKDFLRGYGLQGNGSRLRGIDQLPVLDGFGPKFRDQLVQPGPWTLWLGGWAEALPYYSNKITLDQNKKDSWGLPLVKIDFEYKENETNMRKDILASTEEMLTVAGFKNISSYNHTPIGGATVHEMGTARMGRDPKTSVLNAFNQMHDVKNVFITDGSCMTSGACQNPSLTYMALTARACDYAVTEMKKGNL